MCGTIAASLVGFPATCAAVIRRCLSFGIACLLRAGGCRALVISSDNTPFYTRCVWLDARISLISLGGGGLFGFGTLLAFGDLLLSWRLISTCKATQYPTTPTNMTRRHPMILRALALAAAACFVIPLMPSTGFGQDEEAPAPTEEVADTPAVAPEPEAPAEEAA